MILTITLNPSIDIAYQLETFQLDKVNRVTNVKKTAGGKGLNVTRVLKQFGQDVIATGFIGGDLGNFIEHSLDQTKIQHAFIKIDEETRNCIAVLHEGQQTELLEQGPTISKKEADKLLQHLETLLSQVKVAVISGSLPNGLPDHYYGDILDLCEKFKVKTVVDCSGEPLRAVLTRSSKPTVIKPNKDELSQLLGMEVRADSNHLKQILRNERFDGVEWIIVSLGSQGAFAKHHDRFYRVTIPKIQVVNPVGSGDATVAGIAARLVENCSDSDLLKTANLLGMLNAQEESTGYVDLDKADRWQDQINIMEV